jgi:cell division protease FtsH
VVLNSKLISFVVSWVLPIGFFLFIIFSMRGMMKHFDGGIMGKSNAKMYMQKETGVTFEDVAGQDEAKESLQEIIDFLNNPDKYSKIGAKQPKGALLVGPPGTGKTLLAKAVAGEADVTFMSISGSDFDEMFVGLGASRVRDLFKSAQQNAPCIIFIDELDAVGHKRDNNISSNDQTLNQLLSEMDGFDTSKGIVILGATNRPEVLDPALLRPGRFDRRIIVENPDLKGRVDVLKVHIKDVQAEDDIDLEKIALATSGAAGADLANIVNEAALRAVRFNRDKVTQEDLMESVEVVFAGKEKKDRILSDKEKRLVAFHEVGHALAAALQKNTQPVQKITIIPRTKGALGYTMTMPEEEKYLTSREEIYDEIVMLLAGRTAEEVEFNTATTGAGNDIERATAMARNMIAIYGMGERFDMMQLERVENRYLGGSKVAQCSEVTMAQLDEEVLKVIRECHDKAKSLLSENKDILEEISNFLVEKETITGEEFMKILGECKAEKNKTEDEEIPEIPQEEPTQEV